MIFLTACHDDYSPKKRDFQRIELPAKEYTLLQSNCPFTFKIPTYAVIEHDSLDPKAEPCWFNIRFPVFNATLHVSYKDLKASSLQSVIEDSRTLVYKHTIKAEEINEIPFRLDSQTMGIRYELEGNTATAYQFYLTDAKQHFLRAALYFNSRSNPDSVAPVFQFLKQDAEVMIKSLKWKY
jgi:gliding motility-associated lipoprotein GldD